MSNNIVDQAKVYVALDGRDAETVVSELTAKTEQYTEALTKAYQAGDKIGMKNALKDLKDTEKELANVKKQTFDVTNVMKDLNGSSLGDLKKAEKEITAELALMKRGTDEYTAKTKDLQKVSSEINKVKGEMSGVTDKNVGFTNSFTGLIQQMGLGSTRMGQFAQSTASGLETGAEKVKGFAGAFSIVKTAIAATGIGFLLILIASLFAWFEKTTQGSKTLKMAMAGVGAVIDVITGLFAKLGGFIADAFSHPVESIKKLWQVIQDQIVNRITGVGKIFQALGKIIMSGFTDGYKDLGNAVIQTTYGIKDGLDKAAQLAEKLKQIAKDAYDAAVKAAGIAEREVNLAIAKRKAKTDEAILERQIAQARFDAADKTKEKEDRVNSLTKALQLETQLEEEQNKIEAANNKILHDKYDLKMKAGVKASDDEKEAMSESDAQMIRIETNRLNRTRKMNTQLQTLKQQMLTEDLKEIETNFAQQEAIQKQKLAAGEISEKQYNANILQLNIDQLNAKNKTLEDFKAKYAQDGIDLTDIDKQIADNKSAIEDENLKKRKQDLDDLLKVAEQNGRDIINLRKEQYQRDLTDAGNNAALKKSITEKYNGDILTLELSNLLAQEQFLKAHGQKTVEIEKQIADKKAQIIEYGYQLEDQKRKDREAIRKQYNLISLAEEEKLELDALKEKYAQELISDEEYAQASLAIKMKYVTEYVSKAESILNNMSNAVKGFQDAELTNLQTAKQKELALAGDDANKKKAIEDKYGKDELQIKKKYADKMFIMQVAQIIASTAKTAIEAYQAMAGIPYVGPALGIIAAGVAVAYGASQVAQAKAQRDSVKQLASGKYDVIGNQDGKLYKNVPYVGKASTGLYKGPTLISEQDDEIVLSGSHTRNLRMNYPVLLSALMATRVPQRAEGNYPVYPANADSNQQQQQQNSKSVNVDQLTMLMAANVQVLNRLDSKLDNLYAKLVMDEFKKAESQWDSQKTDVTKF
jgi:uncharacterized membrane protein